jgi:ribosomal protein S4
MFIQSKQEIAVIRTIFVIAKGRDELDRLRELDFLLGRHVTVYKKKDIKKPEMMLRIRKREQVKGSGKNNAGNKKKFITETRSPSSAELKLSKQATKSTLIQLEIPFPPIKSHASYMNRYMVFMVKFI